MKNSVSESDVVYKCPRCTGKFTSPFKVICNSCKNDLIQEYDHNLGWETAWEIEQEKALIRKMKYHK
ncbi:MAG TPA: hypothetical protein VE912_02070 [Bacteroidales bacterium]|nr:hypothetical protein [Bacteroidales bacterium]